MRVFLILLILLVPARPASARTLQTITEYLVSSYPEASRIHEQRHTLTADQMAVVETAAGLHLDLQRDKTFQFHAIEHKGIMIAYVAEHTVKGKWGDIHFATSLDPNGVIKQVRILDYSEVRGKPIKKKRFLRQYEGKSADDQLVLGRNIQAVTGATISSKGMTEGIKKVLHVFRLVYGNN